ncbi:MAG: hypothetical protein WC627_10565 [Legionella sp.]|jgi:hypothetical protein
MKNSHKVKVLEDESFNSVTGGLVTPGTTLGSLLGCLDQRLVASPLPVLSQVGARLNVVISKIPTNIKNIPLPSFPIPH